MCRAVVDEHDILRRIKLLQIRDDQKDGLTAEFHRRRQNGTLKQFEKVLDLPWGVFCTPNPCTRSEGQCFPVNMVTTFYQYDGTRFVETTKLQTKSPNAKLPSLLFFNRVMKDGSEHIDEGFEEKLNKFLGRSVEIVRLRSHSWRDKSVQGSEHVMGCVLKAVRRAGCCNPVIVLQNLNCIKNKAAKQIVLDLLDHKNSANFVDHSIKVPFDLSNVLFIVEGDMSDRARIISSRIDDDMMGKSDDLLAEIRRIEFDWMHESFKPHLNKRLPVGGSTSLCAFLDMELGRIEFIQSSFSEQRTIVNNTKCNTELVNRAFELCNGNAHRFGISTDALKKQFTVLFTKTDGYSVGCTVFLSLHSLFTNRRVRHDSAVSGGITSSGRVSRVTGVLQKTYAAYKCGIRRIVLSGENRESVERDMCERLKNEMEFVYIDNVHELVREMMEVDDS